MAGKWTNGSPVLAGGEGSLVITEEGQQITLANVSSVNADIEHEKSQIQPVGHRIDLHKVTGGEGTGSMTVYFVSSRFGHYMEMYKDRGVSPYFDMVITNHDPASTAKRQIVTLYGVNLDSTTLALLDGSRTELTVDVDFTFEDYAITEAFCPDVDAEYVTSYVGDDMSVMLNLPLCVQYSKAEKTYAVRVKGSDVPATGTSRYYYVGDTNAMPIITGTRKIVTTGSGGSVKHVLQVGETQTVSLDTVNTGEEISVNAADKLKRDLSIMVIDADADGNIIAYGQSQLTPIVNTYAEDATPVHSSAGLVATQTATDSKPITTGKDTTTTK